MDTGGLSGTGVPGTAETTQSSARLRLVGRVTLTDDGARVQSSEAVSDIFSESKLGITLPKMSWNKLGGDGLANAGNWSRNEAYASRKRARSRSRVLKQINLMTGCIYNTSTCLWWAQL